MKSHRVNINTNEINLVWELSHITFWYILSHSLCVLGNKSSLRNYFIDWHILIHTEDFNPNSFPFERTQCFCVTGFNQFICCTRFNAGRPCQEPDLHIPVFTVHHIENLLCVWHAPYQGQSSSENKTLSLCIKLCILVAGIWALHK